MPPSGQQLHRVGAACAWSWQALGSVQEAAPALAQLEARAGQPPHTLALFAYPAPVDSVRWLDRQARHLVLMQAPLTVAPCCRPSCRWEHAASRVFTSATLGDSDDLQWFTRTCGLPEARTLRVASPV